jgi:lipoyl(octanoyl) transferase
MMGAAPVSATSRTTRLLLVGRCDYAETVARMREFTAVRDPDTPDELWALEHPPVFTLGRAARAEHLHDPRAIPVLSTDRGGQVTYHGPGQLVVYTLIDLTRAGLSVRALVNGLEQSIIIVLARHGLNSNRKVGAPGVYVAEQKIASLGLRIQRGRSFHGLSLNVHMDREPFGYIDPCGFPGLEVTDMHTEGVTGITCHSMALEVTRELVETLGLCSAQISDTWETS